MAKGFHLTLGGAAKFAQATLTLGQSAQKARDVSVRRRYP